MELGEVVTTLGLQKGCVQHRLNHCMEYVQTNPFSSCLNVADVMGNTNILFIAHKNGAIVEYRSNVFSAGLLFNTPSDNPAVRLIRKTLRIRELVVSNACIELRSTLSEEELKEFVQYVGDATKRPIFVSLTKYNA